MEFVRIDLLLEGAWHGLICTITAGGVGFGMVYAVRMFKVMAQ